MVVTVKKRVHLLNRVLFIGKYFFRHFSFNHLGLNLGWIENNEYNFVLLYPINK